MNDRIAIECPECGKVFAVGAAFAGKKIRCPQCKGVIQVDGGDTDAPQRKTQPRSPAASSGNASASQSRPAEPRVARPVRGLDDEASEPRRREAAGPPKAGKSARATRKKPVEDYDDQPWGDLSSDDDGYDAFSAPSAMPPRAKRGATQKYKAETTPVGSGGGRTDGGVIVGILMMVGAVVWFVGGLAFGVIFFYPPILFILGLIATIKGALKIGS
ncbi:MAG: hypothetical protein ACK58L_16165 [Planctomycetota bacterium]